MSQSIAKLAFGCSKRGPYVHDVREHVINNIPSAHRALSFIARAYITMTIILSLCEFGRYLQIIHRLGYFTPKAQLEDCAHVKVSEFPTIL